jgi:hypothetical protein
MTAGHVPSHPLHEAVGTFILGGRRRITTLSKFVIDIQENVQSVHNTTLTSRWSTKIKTFGILDAFIDPAWFRRTFGVASLEPWTDVPIKHVGIANGTNGLDNLAYRIDDPRKLVEISCNLRNGSQICNAGQ